MEKTRQILALTKRQFIAVRRLSGEGKDADRELFAPFYSKNFLKIHFIGLLFCYTSVRTKRHRREEE